MSTYLLQEKWSSILKIWDGMAASKHYCSVTTKDFAQRDRSLAVAMAVAVTARMKNNRDKETGETGDKEAGETGDVTPDTSDTPTTVDPERRLKPVVMIVTSSILKMNLSSWLHPILIEDAAVKESLVKF